MLYAIYGIMLDLLSKKQVSASYLARKYEISVRTVYRYVDVLSANRVAVFSVRGRSGGFRIADNCKLRANYLSDEEKENIIYGLRLLKSASPDIDVDTVCAKLESLDNGNPSNSLRVDSDKLYVDGSMIADEQLNLNKIKPLKQAIDERLVVKITYHDRNGEISERNVDPHAFVFKNTVWYLYAYCRLRKEFRLFKLTRIEKLMLSQTKFRRRDKSEFTPWKLDFEQDERQIDILLSVDENARYGVEDWLGVECVTKVEGQNGLYRAAASVRDDDVLLSKLLSFGSGVVILDPPFLAEKTAEAAKNILNNYLKINN